MFYRIHCITYIAGFLWERPPWKTMQNIRSLLTKGLGETVHSKALKDGHIDFLAPFLALGRWPICGLHRETEIAKKPEGHR